MLKNAKKSVRYTIITIFLIALIPILLEGLPRVWLGTTSWKSLQGVEDIVSWEYVIFRNNHNQKENSNETLFRGSTVTLTGVQKKRSALTTCFDSYGRSDKCRNYSQVITESGKIGWVATNSLTIAPAKVLKPLDGWFWAGTILFAIDCALVVLVKWAKKN